MRTWLLVTGIAMCHGALAIEQTALRSILEEARVEMELPGVRAAIRLPDGRIVRQAVGFADLEAATPLDDTSGMPGGSTGKSFVAAIAMLLIEDGLLSLEDPAADWLGEKPWFHRLPNADAIRVRHLLAHAAGIGDYPDSFRFQVATIWRAVRGRHFEPEELIAYVSPRPHFAPGKGFRYTDAGYLVLGRLLEAASGREYFELLRERILDPLGLDEIQPADRPIIPRVVTGYSRGAPNLNEAGRMKFDPRSEWTGGGLVTNPTMLVRFYAALADGRIVKPETFSRMVNAGWRNPDGSDDHYGFGLFVFDGGASFGHGGMWPGYRTHVIHVVDADTTVAVQTNRDGALDLAGLTRRIAALAAGSDTDAR